MWLQAPPVLRCGRTRRGQPGWSGLNSGPRWTGADSRDGRDWKDQISVLARDPVGRRERGRPVGPTSRPSTRMNDGHPSLPASLPIWPNPRLSHRERNRTRAAYGANAAPLDVSVRPSAESPPGRTPSATHPALAMTSTLSRSARFHQETYFFSRVAPFHRCRQAGRTDH